MHDISTYIFIAIKALTARGIPGFLLLALDCCAKAPEREKGPRAAAGGSGQGGSALFFVFEREMS